MRTQFAIYKLVNRVFQSKNKLLTFKTAYILITKIFDILFKQPTDIQWTNQHQVDDRYSEYVKAHIQKWTHRLRMKDSK